eukprot:SM000018S03620  [mRNA]  locus=s18:313951:315837:- [translate_table: standard]
MPKEDEAGGGGGGKVAGVAKLVGEDFEFVVRKYSVTLGRASKRGAVDLDLAALGGGMNISRQHACLYYSFDRRRFELEVLGKNGLHVRSELHLGGCPAVPLASQDLLQIGDKLFYFLLPAELKPNESTADDSPIKAAAARTDTAAAAAARPGGSPLQAGPQPATPVDRPAIDGLAKPAAPSRRQVLQPPEGAASDSEHPGNSGSRSSPNSGGAAPKKGDDLEAGEPPRGPAAPAFAAAVELQVNDAVASILHANNPGEPMALATVNLELQAQFPGLYEQAQRLGVLPVANQQPSNEKHWAGLGAVLGRNTRNFTRSVRLKGRALVDMVELRPQASRRERRNIDLNN